MRSTNLYAQGGYSVIEGRRRFGPSTMTWRKTARGMRPVWGQTHSPRSDVSSVPALSCILECRAPPGICPASSLPYRCTGSETWEGNNGNARRLITWGIACHGHALSFKWWARASVLTLSMSWASSQAGPRIIHHFTKFTTFYRRHTSS